MTPFKTSRDGDQRVVNDLAFPSIVKVRHRGVRPSIRSVADALRLIEQDLPIELQRLPRWKFAQALLEHVARTGKKKDLNNAFRQLRQCLSDEGWLAA
jgi:hypothetical protein